MADATFYHGHPLMVDYTPSVAVTAGDVIETGEAGIPIVIAHHDIEAGEKGSVAVGGGVYRGVANAPGVAFTAAFWDGTGFANAGTAFGYWAADVGSGDVAEVYHHPQQ